MYFPLSYLLFLLCSLRVFGKVFFFHFQMDVFIPYINKNDSFFIQMKGNIILLEFLGFIQYSGLERCVLIVIVLSCIMFEHFGIMVIVLRDICQDLCCKSWEEEDLFQNKRGNTVYILTRPIVAPVG